MSESPFGPVQAGMVGNRADNDSRVIRFPDMHERAVRKDMRESTDPIDVAMHFDPTYRKGEVQRRMASTPKEQPGRAEKALRWLGLVEE